MRIDADLGHGVSIDSVVAQRRKRPTDDSRYTLEMSKLLNRDDRSLVEIFGLGPQKQPADKE